MLRVGLTGGIGSGKSTVARQFAELGVPIIDTDVIARDLVAPGRPLLTRIAEQFGADLLTADGSLDRERLRDAVFEDPDKRRQLEDLLHPAIRERMLRQADAASGPYLILVVPLLVEKGWQSLVDRVLVVDALVDDQIRRTMARDGLPEARVRSILATQASREQRLAAADDVIRNEGSLDKLLQQVQDLHRFYLQLAAQPRP